MANTKTRIGRDGYGQLELNQVAFRRDGRIEAQAQLNKAFNANDASYVTGHATFVENGMLLELDPVTRTVNYPSNNSTTALLHYSTEHIYDERTPGLKNFKLDFGTFLPRLGYLATGDKFTTNCVSYMKGSDTETGGTPYADETALFAAMAPTALASTPMYGHASADGTIIVNAVNSSTYPAMLKVIGATTMPDGQNAVKFIAL